MKKRNKELLFVSGLVATVGVGGPGAGQTLHYTARLHGVPLFEVSWCLRVEGGAYATRLTARTLGLAEFLVHGRVEGSATGTAVGDALKPREYLEHGRIAGEDFDLAMGFEAGTPVVQREIPPAEKYREPVPAAQLPGSIDGLSAIALDVLATRRSGACHGSALVFDGRQLRRLTTATAGSEMLAPSARSIFTGSALRCDTVSVMLSGFLKDKPVARQARPYHSSAWLAALAPGGLAVPVKFTFDADALGDILVDLDRVDAGACS